MSTRLDDFPALSARLKPECERIVAQYEHKRSALLPLMHLFQQHEGYVSREAMRFAADMLDVTPAVVESTVSFYTLFFRRPVGKYMLQVCRGLSCSIQNAEDIMAYFREKLGVGHLETTAGRPLFVRRSRVSGGVRSRDVHASEPRVRLRPHAGNDRRDAGRDARGHVRGGADRANGRSAAARGAFAKTAKSRRDGRRRVRPTCRARTTPAASATRPD